jgi:hypothetical protein
MDGMMIDASHGEYINAGDGTAAVDLGQSQLDSLLMNSFINEAKKNLAWLEDVFKRNMLNNDITLRKFSIIMRNLKNSLWSIEEVELTELALDLEKCWNEHNIKLIAEVMPDFLAKLRALLENKSS